MKRKNGIQQKMKRIAALLGAAVLAVWLVFYLHTANSIQMNNEAHLAQVSRQIIERLEAELLGLESMAFTLASDESVKEFLAEPDPLLFHTKSARVGDLLDDLTGTAGFAQHMTAVTEDGIYANFGVNMGQAASQAVADMFTNSTLPRYTAVEAEGTRYIGYGSNVFDDGGEMVGVIVLLAEEERLLGLFSEYVTTEGLAVSMAENGLAVTSSDSSIVGRGMDELTQKAALYQSSDIGFAPFEIYVTAGDGYVGAMTRRYALAAAISAGLAVVILMAYLFLSKRYFIKPMLDVMDGVGRLGAEDSEASRISETRSEDFDGLVRQINSMLERLEEKSRALLNAHSRLQSAEIERQAALIVSLKKQINAHFTVNILSIIKALSESGETEKAALMSDGLSHLLRYANDGDEYISGMDEIQVLEKYAAMMEIRFSRRFTAEFDWSDRLMQARMPRMLVQPVIENAIVHGFAGMTGGRLSVCGGTENGSIEISIKDNGRGMTERELHRLLTEIRLGDAPVWNVGGTDRVALSNICRRLRSYYGEAGTLTVESARGAGTTVIIRFPCT